MPALLPYLDKIFFTARDDRHGVELWALPLQRLKGLPQFDRDDANADGATDVTDTIAILGFLFLGDNKVPCQQAGDVSDDGSLDISDAVYVLSFLFPGGKPIEPPVGACGVDPTGHDLPCSSFPGCQ